MLNALTGADVYVENKLFATLDTSTKVLQLLVTNDGKVTKFPKKILVSDTVGFIKNLPHNLIESFKSTLLEVIESDLLLHLVDVSNENFRDQMEVVTETLKEIGAENKKTINVFNKTDVVEDPDLIRILKNVFISAEKGLNLNSLMEEMKSELNSENTERTIKLKPDEHKKVSMIYKLAEVSKIKYLKSGIKVSFRTNDKNYSKLKTLAE